MEEEQVQQIEAPEEPAAEPEVRQPAQEEKTEPAPEALADEICARWQRQAEVAREFFPGLDLGREMENPRFQNLLLGGAEVEDAYFATHRAEILPALMSYNRKGGGRKACRGTADGGGTSGGKRCGRSVRRRPQTGRPEDGQGGISVPVPEGCRRGTNQHGVNFSPLHTHDSAFPAAGGADQIEYRL